MTMMIAYVSMQSQYRTSSSIGLRDARDCGDVRLTDANKAARTMPRWKWRELGNSIMISQTRGGRGERPPPLKQARPGSAARLQRPRAFGAGRQELLT